MLRVVARARLQVALDAQLRNKYCIYFQVLFGIFTTFFAPLFWVLLAP